MRIARWALMFSLLALSAAPFAGPAPAQDQDNSVAAAARRAQEQKKSQSKSAHVYDNDSLPSSGHLNVVGQEPAASSGTASTTTAQAVEQKPAPTAAEVAAANAGLDKAKQRLADLRADLDVAQRKYILDQATYLSDPNHSMNKAGAAALNTETSDLDAKAAAVAEAERALAAAQAKAEETNKAAAAEAKAAQTQAANSAAAQPSAPAQPAAPAQNQPAHNPDSDTVTVNQ